MTSQQEHKNSILLVEDERLVALHEKHILSEAGYDVAVASTGEQALEMAGGEYLPDLILMDIDLGPGMDGTEAARAILRFRDVPILFLSSHVEPEVVEKTDKISCYGYVVKNSGTVVLLASIRTALRLHRSEHRFHEILSQVRDVAVQGYSADGTTIFWNGASEDLYGYSAQEAIGVKLWDLIVPAPIVPAVKRSVHAMITSGKPTEAETLVLQRKDGSPVRVRTNHSITHNAAGAAELFCIDIPLDTNTDP